MILHLFYAFCVCFCTQVEGVRMAPRMTSIRWVMNNFWVRIQCDFVCSVYFVGCYLRLVDKLWGWTLLKYFKLIGLRSFLLICFSDFLHYLWIKYLSLFPPFRPFSSPCASSGGNGNQRIAHEDLWRGRRRCVCVYCLLSVSVCGKMIKWLWNSLDWYICDVCFVCWNIYYALKNFRLVFLSSSNHYLFK